MTFFSGNIGFYIFEYFCNFSIQIEELFIQRCPMLFWSVFGKGQRLFGKASVALNEVLSRVFN